LNPAHSSGFTGMVAGAGRSGVQRITDRTSALRGNGAEHRSTWGGACRSGVQESRTERPCYGETARSTVLRGAERAAPACKNHGPNVRVTGKRRGAPFYVGRSVPLRRARIADRTSVLRGKRRGAPFYVGRSVPLRRARIADRTSALRGKRGGAPFYVVVGASRSGVQESRTERPCYGENGAEHRSTWWSERAAPACV
jgi:hypothetical protein